MTPDERFRAAAQRGELDEMRTLLDSGVDINSRDREGKVYPETDSQTALHFAVDNSWEPIVAFLLENGANSELNDAYGFSARDFIEQGSNDKM